MIGISFFLSIGKLIPRKILFRFYGLCERVRDGIGIKKEKFLVFFSSSKIVLYGDPSFLCFFLQYLVWAMVW